MDCTIYGTSSIGHMLYCFGGFDNVSGTRTSTWCPCFEQNVISEIPLLDGLFLGGWLFLALLVMVVMTVLSVTALILPSVPVVSVIASCVVVGMVVVVMRVFSGSIRRWLGVRGDCIVFMRVGGKRFIFSLMNWGCQYSGGSNQSNE